MFLFVVVEVISATGGRRTDDGEQGKVKSVKMNGQTKRGGLEPKSHSLFLPVWVSGEKGPRKAKFFLANA